MRRFRRIVLFLHIATMVFVATMWLIVVTLTPSYELQIKIASILATGITPWLFISWKWHSGRWWDPYSIFLAAACFFNLSHTYLEIFGLNKNNILRGSFYAHEVPGIIYATIFGIMFFHLGALFVPPLRKKIISISDFDLTYYVRIVGWFLFVISIVPVLLTLAEGVQTVMASGYVGLYLKEARTGAEGSVQILSWFVVPACIFLLIGSKNDLSVRRLSLIVILGYSVTLFLMGYRGHSVMPLIAYFWVWNYAVRRVRASLAIWSGLILLVLVFPTIRAVRSLSGSERFSVTTITQEFKMVDNPLVAVLDEMGMSMSTTGYTMDLVPYMRDYDYGQSYIYAVYAVVPNFGSELHPSVARGTPSAWLTRTVNPWMARNGGGLGYSFVAETYLNFGWAGIILLMTIQGLLLSRFVFWGTQGLETGVFNPVKLALIGTYIGFFLMYARGDSSGIFRLLVWYSVFPYIMVYILKYTLRSLRIKKLNIKTLVYNENSVRSR